MESTDVFSPTPAEVEQARRTLEAERNGLAATGMDGELVDAAHVTLAEELLARTDGVEAR